MGGRIHHHRLKTLDFQHGYSRESGNPESREVANFGIVMLIWSTGFPLSRE